jgi:hypothetical protein
MEEKAHIPCADVGNVKRSSQRTIQRKNGGNLSEEITGLHISAIRSGAIHRVQLIFKVNITQ